MKRLSLFAAGLLLPAWALAQPAQPCPRLPAGSTLAAPPDLFSQNGVLSVNFTYLTRVDQNGTNLFCFVTDDGTQNPTLHVHPGDLLVINFKNGLSASAAPHRAHAMPMMTMSGSPGDACGALAMTSTSVNIHYHGTNTSPVCHSDEVIKTLVNAGESFQYRVQFPSDEPPGLYWYHPHVHGIAEAAVQGGASGAIIVEGIENVNPAVAGLRERVMVIRDNPVPGSPTPGGAVPSWDISVNFIPIPYPAYTPAVIPMNRGEKQFWRVVNATADTILDLQVQYDGVPQPLQIIGLDGVPVGSQDGTGRGKSFTKTDILLATAARAEFIVTAPGPNVKNATFLTLNIDTGPIGDTDPQRPIGVIQLGGGGDRPKLRTVPAVSGPPGKQRFAGLADENPTANRTLYFSEVLSDPNNPLSPTNFFITVDGATPTLFSASNPPAIVTTQGSVEDWTIQNRTGENHEFHMHQIHFLQLEQNGVPVANGQYLDMIQVPYWTGTGPYPSVKVRMDFRGPDIGDFVYHCHILGHEDNGMMAIIQVNPGDDARSAKAPAPSPASKAVAAKTDAAKPA
ncbi:MAG TPA: multicopper oxidase domain-containing protein, partial [Thermoanaerobaculia bacterium]|nr:multicopper oxidase domain-containing protein [Thermoanaerobaculia bacterium]